MGFRNPATSATAVDTGHGQTDAGVRVYQDLSTPGVPRGVAEWRTGRMDRNATATLSGGGSGGSAFVLDGGAALGVAAPQLQLNVEGAAAGGYTPVARVTGGPLIVQGAITGAAPVDTASLDLDTTHGYWSGVSGRGVGWFIDAAGFVCLDGGFTNTVAFAAGTSSVLITTVPTPPKVNRWFHLPIYPTASVALVGVRTSGQVLIDQLGGAVPVSSFWDPSVIRFNPTATT